MVINLYRQMVMAGDLQPLVMISRWSALRPLEQLVDGRPTVYWRQWSPWPRGRSVTGLLKFLAASPLWVLDLMRLCRRRHLVAINVHFPDLGAFPFALLRFLRLYRGALIVSFHGADLREPRQAGRLERALWRFLLRQSTALVACSEAFAADVRDFAGPSADKVHAIHNGLDVEYFLGHVDRAGGLPAGLESRDFILSVATWERKKGLDVLLRAFAEVRRHRPDLALVLVGRASDAEFELRTLASELAMAGDVWFIESLPHAQVGVFLERARAFCLPSRAEPFGIVILEAGAHRLPVVATRVGGIPEILSGGETGILVEPDDADALAAALRRVLSEPEFARSLGEQLYRRVAGTFSWKRAYGRYLALCRRVPVLSGNEKT